jgi:hypothetical protein
LASPNGEPEHFALAGKVLGAFQMAYIQYDPDIIPENTPQSLWHLTSNDDIRLA